MGAHAVDDARPEGLHEHEAAVIAVTRDKDAVLLLRTLEQHISSVARARPSSAAETTSWPSTRRYVSVAA
jgi:hypothetical protein